MTDEEHIRLSNLILAACNVIPFVGGWNGASGRVEALEAAIKEYTGNEWYDMVGDDEWHH